MFLDNSPNVRTYRIVKMRRRASTNLMMTVIYPLCSVACMWVRDDEEAEES
jgi:hypothetical protein